MNLVKLHLMHPDTPAAVWRIADALTRVKRLIIEAVEQWNMRLCESIKKRDSDKKRDKAFHTESDSSILTDTRILKHSVDSEARNMATEPTTNMITKKIKSLDQSDGKILHFTQNY